MKPVDIKYLDNGSERSASRIALLEAQKLTVGTTEAGTVTVLDAEKLSDIETNARVENLNDSGSRLLVLFSLSHGVSFRERRDQLLSLGAHDVMSATGVDDEFLTRVRALKHQSQPPSILIVEDEDDVGNWAVDVLTEAGMDVERVANLTEAQSRFEAGPLDALVVDRMLPDGDGLNFIAQLRDLGIRIPALLFTALNSVEDRIHGLEVARADDYICKPVHEDELRVRVQVLLRPLVSDENMVFGPLEINRKDRLVRWRGDRVDLRPKECEMLIYLAERHGLPIPKRMIYLDVWQKTYMDVGSNPVTAARHRLVRDFKSALAARSETYPEFLGTDGDAYVFQAESLLQLPPAPEETP